MKRIIIITIILLIFRVGLISKIVNTYDFLNIPETGRNEIASGSGKAVADDISSIFGNPAGFGGNQKRSIMLSDTENIADTRKISLFFGDSLNIFNYIVGLKYFYLNDPIITSYDKIEYKQYSLDLLLAKKLNMLKGINFGLHIQYISSQIGIYKSSLILFHTGVSYPFALPCIIGKNSRNKSIIGAGIYNIGNVIEAYNNKEDIPVKINTGVKYRWLNLGYLNSDILGDYINNSSDFSYFTIGIKAYLFKIISLSFANQFNDSINSYSIGVGLSHTFKAIEYEFNYTMMPVDKLEDIHLISIRVRL